MAQSQSARSADLEAPHRIAGPDITAHRRPRGRAIPMARDLPGSAPSLTAAALGRLIARIESGIASPEDVASLPDGVLDYLAAVITLHEMGVLDWEWQAMPIDGAVVGGAAR